MQQADYQERTDLCLQQNPEVVSFFYFFNFIPSDLHQFISVYDMTGITDM